MKKILVSLIIFVGFKLSAQHDHRDQQPDTSKKNEKPKNDMSKLNMDSTYHMDHSGMMKM